jgi:hypothetical protein
MEHDTKCQTATTFSALCLLCITEYEEHDRSRSADEPEPTE